MQMNIDLVQLQQLQQENAFMYQYCADHLGCKECEIHKGNQMQIGNSIFSCENIGKGKE